MRLSRGWTAVIGIATGWVALYPFVLMVVGIGTFLAIVLSAALDTPDFSWLAALVFLAMFILHFATTFLQMGLSLFYLVHVIMNREGADSVRVILAVGMRLLPSLAMLVYFFLYLWPDRPPEWARDRGGVAAPAADGVE